MTNTVGDPRDLQRRRFLARAIAAIHTSIVATLGVILGGAILSPGFARRSRSWLKAASLSELVDREPTAVTIRTSRDDGYAQVVDRQVVFLVRTGDARVEALSSTCTHLGCRVSWNAEAHRLQCPCHGGAFDASGAVVAGPPPRPLSKLATRIEGDQVLVEI